MWGIENRPIFRDVADPEECLRQVARGLSRQARVDISGSLHHETVRRFDRQVIFREQCPGAGYAVRLNRSRVRRSSFASSIWTPSPSHASGTRMSPLS